MTCSTVVLLIVTLISSSGDGLNNLLKTCLIFINFPILFSSFLSKRKGNYWISISRNSITMIVLSWYFVKRIKTSLAQHTVLSKVWRALAQNFRAKKKRPCNFLCGLFLGQLSTYTLEEIRC